MAYPENSLYDENCHFKGGDLGNALLISFLSLPFLANIAEQSYYSMQSTINVICSTTIL